MNEQIFLTALPRRIKRRNGRLVAELSVHVAPWLLLDGTLSDFAFATWATTVLNMGFLVELDGGARFETAAPQGGGQVRRAVVTSRPDPALFASLLPGNTPVKAHSVARALPAQKILSYPNAGLSAALQEDYARLAVDLQTSRNYPRHVDLQAGMLGESVSRHGTERKQRVEALRRSLDSVGSVAQQDAADIAEMLTAFESFHAVKELRVSPAPPDREFHSLISVFGGYPDLVRRLGFAVDLELEAEVDTDLPSTAGPGIGMVRVTPIQAVPGVVTPSRWTAYTLDQAKGLFLAAGRGEIERGLLRLPKKTYSVVQVDVDGTLHKRLAIGAAAASDYATRSEPLGAPAIQSHGLALVRNGHATWLQDRWRRHTSLAVSPKTKQSEVRGADRTADDTYFAEDLTRGYAVDVQVIAKVDGPCDEPWTSLCTRRGRFEVFDPTTNSLRLAWPGSDSVDGEGWTSSAITKIDPTNEAGADARTGESVFRWTGWGLNVPFPRKDPGTPPELPSPSQRLRVVHKAVPRSLPKLRCGWTYRMRLRAVDLAGNALTHSEAESFAATDTALKHRYGRTEPISGPLLVSGNNVEAGLSVVPAKGRLVERFVIRRYFDGRVFKKTEPAEYHVLAPRVSVEITEQLGALDRSADRSFNEINARDIPWKELPEWEHALRQDGDLPYLGDPTVAGFALVDLPGTKPSETVIVPADGSARSRVLVVLESGSGRPEPLGGHSMESGERVRLREDGGVTRVRISCVPTTAAASTFALLDWTRGRAGADVQRLIARGEHVMTSPFREVEFIHALQVPFTVGTVEAIAIEPRKVDQLQVRASTAAQVHARSTGSVRLTAHWTEYLPTGEKDERQAEVYHAALEHKDNDQENTGTPDKLSPLACDFTHSLPDGRYRRLRYRITAISRFAAFFDENLPKSRIGELSQFVDILNTVKPAPIAVGSSIPTFLWQEHPSDGGVARSREASGIRVFLDAPFSVSGEGEMVGVVVFTGTMSDADRKRLRDVVSMVGADPIWTHELPVVPLKLSAFLPGPHRTDPVDIPLSAVDQSTNRTSAVSIKVVPHLVQVDQGRRYIDVVLDAGGSYGPFVRLALVRYQKHSVDDSVSVSFASPLDVMQLLPQRNLELRWHETGLAVHLRGPSYALGTGVHAPPVLEIMVERRERDWWRLVTKVEMVGVPSGTGQVAWNAPEIAIDDTRRGRQRVSLNQFEVVPSDAGPTRRLVYSDVHIIEPSWSASMGESAQKARDTSYARAAAVEYARTHWRSVCHDGFIAGKFGSANFRRAAAGTLFQHLNDPNNPECIRVDGETINFGPLDDCTHFISCCLGGGGGLAIPRDFPTGPYGIISAKKLVQWLLDSGTATAIAVPDKSNPPLDRLRVGDLIAYYRASTGRYTHLVMYLGNYKIVCHTYCRSDDPACTWDNEYTLGQDDDDVRWTFLRVD